MFTYSSGQNLQSRSATCLHITEEKQNPNCYILWHKQNSPSAENYLQQLRNGEYMGNKKKKKILSPRSMIGDVPPVK